MTNTGYSGENKANMTLSSHSLFILGEVITTEKVDSCTRAVYKKEG